MNFAAKYEILEPITRGSVETFIARVIATDARVLIHIFECPEQAPDQPTVQWVLDSFHAIAPDTPELVLGTGRYSGTSYAYLVTKLPDNLALREWVGSYEAQEEAKETAASPRSVAMPEGLHASNNGLAPNPSGADEPTVISERNRPNETASIPEDQQSHAQASSDTGDAPSAGRPKTPGLSVTIIDFSGTSFAPAEKVQTEPGELTRQWSEFEKAAPGDLAQSNSSGTPSTGERPLPVPQVTPRNNTLDIIAETRTPGGTASPYETPIGSSQTPPPVAGAAGDAGITDLFRFGEVSEPQSPLDSDSDKRDDIKTGEFTHFFRGPFHGEGSSQTPDLSLASARPQKQPSEFTKIFGESTDVPSHGTIASESRLREAPFGDDPRAPIHSSDNTGHLPTFLERSSPSSTVPPTPPMGSPAVGTDPGLQSGKSWGDAETAFKFRPATDGATRVFSPPARDSLPGAGTSQAGPSEFTRIINRVEEPFRPSGSHDDLAEKPAAMPGESPLHSPLPATPTPQFQAPAPWKMPAAPAPQFQQPAPPRMPAPPTVSAPPIPQAPQLASASPKAAGVPWMPIIVINGLFILAVLLVLYFALKR